MLIHQIPNRIIKFKGNGSPAFPADVEIHCDLVPHELFGESDLSGKLHLHPAGQPIQLKPDLMQGGIRTRLGGRLARAMVDTFFFDFRLQIQGVRATISGRFSDQSSFNDHIFLIANYLPAFLASAFQEPVEIERLTGQVAGKPFQVSFLGEYEYIIRVDDVAKSVSREMSRLQALPALYKKRIFSALRYVNQARWLEYVAPNPNQFGGERLLNLAKAIEVTFGYSGGYEAVELLRRELRLLRLREEVLELIASVIYVRNQVDVGHCKLSLLQPSEHYTFHKFVQKATSVVSWLLRHVVDEVSGGRYELTVPDGPSEAPALSYVAQLLKKVELYKSSDYLRTDRQAGPMDADSRTNADN